MFKLASAVAFSLIATYPSFGQDYCEQVRQGIVIYGYEAARQYAVEHYTPEQVKAADACVIKLKLRRQTGETQR